jgi:hypothetical protein
LESRFVVKARFVGTSRLVVPGIALALLVGHAPSVEAQYDPRNRLQPRGLGVAPTFEGWFRNPDGTYTLSFGYFNRNTDEVVTIPVGDGNHVSPGEMDQGQPTLFESRRGYGIFTVVVPADFGPEDRVTWTLERNGERYAIPGGLLDSYETANLHAPAIDMYPPVLVMREGGPETRGPAGERLTATARVGEPLELRAWAWDEHGHEVTLRWYAYRAPGEVVFAEDAIPLEIGERESVTTATFSEPGDYIVYARVDHTERGVRESGLEQCCWTNGWVAVTVTPQ